MDIHVKEGYSIKSFNPKQLLKLILVLIDDINQVFYIPTKIKVILKILVLLMHLLI